MATYKGTIKSASAALDWTNIIGSGAFAEGAKGSIVVRSSQDGRVAVGVIDPVASNTAGIAVVAGEATRVLLGGEAAQQTIWVQTPADESDVTVEVDDGGDNLLIVLA